MRAVNLLPQEQRRVRASGERSGSAYGVVGALALVLVATAVYALSANEVASKNAEADRYAAQANAVEAEVAALAPFGEFSAMKETRVASVEDMAAGRLDWERLTRELALVLPRNTWLLKLDGDSTGDASAAPGSTDTLDGPGAPSLLLTGCAKDQPSVATALVRLRRLSGATAVELQSSKKPENGDGNAGENGGQATCGDNYEFAAMIELEPAAADDTNTSKAENVPTSLGGWLMSVTGRDRKILMVIIAIAVAAGYWFLLLSPTREQADAASARAQTEQARVSTAQAQLATLQQAKANYSADYATVVRLGKAIPTSVDTASLMIQLQDAANGTDIRFTGIETGQRTAVEAAPPQSLGTAAAAEEGKKSGGEAPKPANGAEDAAAAERDAALAAREDTPAARQAAAEGQAQDAPAGLEQVPLEFTFNGSFFDLADFFHEMKRFVSVANQKIEVSGRLVTIDQLSFATKPSFPDIEATVSATAYVSPKAEGVTAGATSEGPASEPASAPAPAAPTTPAAQVKP